MTKKKDAYSVIFCPTGDFNDQALKIIITDSELEQKIKKELIRINHGSKESNKLYSVYRKLADLLRRQGGEYAKCAPYYELVAKIINIPSHEFDEKNNESYLDRFAFHKVVSMINSQHYRFTPMIGNDFKNMYEVGQKSNETELADEFITAANEELAGKINEILAKDYIKTKDTHSFN